VITRYKTIRFVARGGDGRRRLWDCYSLQGDRLGFVTWYEPWAQYCYFPADGAVFSQRCLRDIAGFLKRLGDVERVQLWLPLLEEVER
jgi:hypothetical protein